MFKIGILAIQVLCVPFSISSRIREEAIARWPSWEFRPQYGAIRKYELLEKVEVMLPGLITADNIAMLKISKTMP